ncbi:MAG: DUF2284 domain-containing protein [Nanoarchaeota archaeon]
MHTQTLIVHTPQHDVEVECRYRIINTKDVPTSKQQFADMCKQGCRNYDSKYCCPPFSPSFQAYVKEPYMLLLILKIDLDQFDYKEYHKLRVGNAIIKPRIERVMRALEPYTDSKFCSSGACRLCKPCKRKANKPCQHPDKMRFSLEALGVDCNKLAETAFHVPLVWYKEKKAPTYTSVLSGLPLRKQEDILDLTRRTLKKTT